MKKILTIVMVLILALVGYRILQPENSINNATADVATDTSTTPASTSLDFDDIPPTYVDSDLETVSAPVGKTVLSTQQAVPSYACDGRQHCSQMTSCAEATYFSNNCPNTKMDGNNDGVPCEEQWCN
jgi:hypothetical protein